MRKIILILIFCLIFVGCSKSPNINQSVDEGVIESNENIKDNSEIKLIDFHSEETGLSFKHPKEWVEDFPKADGVIVSLNTNKEPDSNINFAYYLLKENEYDNFDVTIKSFIDDYKDQFVDFELLYYGEKEYNELKFIEATFSAIFDGRKLVLSQYITQKGHVAFYITTTSTPESTSEYISTVQTILESVVIADIDTDYFKELDTSVNENIIEYIEYNDETKGISFNIPKSWNVSSEQTEALHVIFGKHKLVDSGFTMAIANLGNYDERVAWIKGEIEPNVIFMFDKDQLNLEFDNGQSIEGYLIIYSDLDDNNIEKKFASFLGRSPESENASLMLSFESIMDGQSEEDIIMIFNEFVKTINIEDYPQY